MNCMQSIDQDEPALNGLLLSWFARRLKHRLFSVLPWQELHSGVRPQLAKGWSLLRNKRQIRSTKLLSQTSQCIVTSVYLFITYRFFNAEHTQQSCKAFYLEQWFMRREPSRIKGAVHQEDKETSRALTPERLCIISPHRQNTKTIPEWIKLNGTKQETDTFHLMISQHENLIFQVKLNTQVNLLVLLKNFSEFEACK